MPTSVDPSITRQFPNPMKRFLLPLVVALVVAVAPHIAQAQAPVSPAPVADWSREAQRAIVPPGPNGVFGQDNYGNKSPGDAAVYMAIVHAAMYDAALAIQSGYQPYAIRLPIRSDASPAAAIATAAHHVLVDLQPALGLTPEQQARLDARYADYLAAIPDGASKTSGIAVGDQVAQALRVLRANDGREDNPQLGQPPFVPPPAGPGVWDAGTAAPVGLRQPGIRSLALRSASQFRPAAPNLLTSATYAADFEEVVAMGALDSTSRTEEDNALALFWTDHDLRQWNDGLLGLAAARDLDLVQTARLLAMAHVSGGDGLIACYDAKYTYWFWRPFQAIAAEDPTALAWQPLRTTPNHPEYPSGHSCHTGAMVEAVRGYFGTDAVSLSLDSRITGATRSYDRLQDVTLEVERARVLAGLHFRASDEVGTKLGQNVGRYVVNNFFQPLD